MIGGGIGALAFIGASWFGLSRGWNFGLVLLAGALAWLTIVLVVRYGTWRW